VTAKKAAGTILILLGVALTLATALAGRATQHSGPAANAQDSPPTPLWQAEPVVPTALPPAQNSAAAATVAPITLPAAGATSVAAPLLPAPARFGVGVPDPPLTVALAQTLGIGWYVSWRVQESPAAVPHAEFWQMVRLQADGFRPDAATIRRVAQANPGTTWLIGNEPDVKWQDNVSPARYAAHYHKLYRLIKEADPTARVAIGGITQPTPLRLQYLELVLATYQASTGQPMPVDVWNIHNFILPEQRDSWGVDIPPGLDVDQGQLYTLDEHDNLAIFQQQLIDFRRWMAARGERNKPLVVSEYGILMPESYGFGPERVQTFLYGTYDFMRTATDAKLGYPADGNRLVQRWAWFSLADARYPTGNLINLASGQLTPLGQAHQRYIQNLP